MQRWEIIYQIDTSTPHTHRAIFDGSICTVVVVDGELRAPRGWCRLPGCQPAESLLLCSRSTPGRTQMRRSVLGSSRRWVADAPPPPRACSPPPCSHHAGCRLRVAPPQPADSPSAHSQRAPAHAPPPQSTAHLVSLGLWVGVGMGSVYLGRGHEVGWIED